MYGAGGLAWFILWAIEDTGILLYSFWEWWCLVYFPKSDMERLNLNQLLTLRILLEERNLTRAADKLFLTQSAISKQLSQLRSYFNDPLLIREGNVYWLSVKAEMLLPRLQRILSDIDALTENGDFNPRDCRRQFRFASTDYVAQFIFPAIAKRLAFEAPHVDVVYEMMKPEWMHQLGKLHLDFVCLSNPSQPDNVHAIPLGRDQSVCMMARNHPLASVGHLSLDMLLDYPFVLISSGGDKDSFFDRHLEAKKLRRRVAIEVPFFSAAFEIVAGGDFLLIVSEHVAIKAQERYAMTYRQLPFDSPANCYQLCWHGIHHKDEAHVWMRSLISDEIRGSLYSPYI